MFAYLYNTGLASMTQWQRHKLYLDFTPTGIFSLFRLSYILFKISKFYLRNFFLRSEHSGIRPLYCYIRISSQKHIQSFGRLLWLISFVSNIVWTPSTWQHLFSILYLPPWITWSLEIITLGFYLRRPFYRRPHRAKWLYPTIVHCDRSPSNGPQSEWTRLHGRRGF